MVRNRNYYRNRGRDDDDDAPTVGKALNTAVHVLGGLLCIGAAIAIWMYSGLPHDNWMTMIACALVGLAGISLLLKVD